MAIITDPHEIARLVRNERERMKLTQQQFASLMNVSQATVSRWERAAGTARPVFVVYSDQCGIAAVSLNHTDDIDDDDDTDLN